MEYWILNVALEPRSFLCILPNIKEEINERREGIESQNKQFQKKFSQTFTINLLPIIE